MRIRPLANHLALIMWVAVFLGLTLLSFSDEDQILFWKSQLRNRGSLQLKDHHYVLLTGGSLALARATFPERVPTSQPQGMSRHAWELQVDFKHLEYSQYAPPFYRGTDTPFWNKYGFANITVEHDYGIVSHSYNLIGFPLWVLQVPFLPIGFLFARNVWRWWREILRLRRGACPLCGYDLRECTDRCPECGRPKSVRRESGKGDIHHQQGS